MFDCQSSLLSTSTTRDRWILERSLTYRYLRNLFHNHFRSKGFEYDHIFDWTIKRFSELHSEGG
ncbi:hypothetical protein F4825DRAFT_440965 [Nemania diffusa]|nr:hypothetical protein F4825DRAFT_440965 [Nemania diffusa]